MEREGQRVVTGVVANRVLAEVAPGTKRLTINLHTRPNPRRLIK
jgi:hypothetical protein